MKIDGRALAQHILDELKIRVDKLAEHGVTPHLAVILVGDNPSSKAYVHQKELKAGQIGVKISVFRYPASISETELLQKIDELNNDPSIHGIIIQRPLPPHINGQKITDETNPQKDVDGFHADSPFDPPVALAVLRILQEVHKETKETEETFASWLQTKQTVILGKGQTAGMPIIKYLQKQQAPLTIVDSKTPNKDGLLKNADIVISAVGREDMIKVTDIKDGAIIIGVGMFQNSDGKLQGDYNQEQISKKTSAYTTIPGGVGPVNVAMLLKNLIDASEK